MLARARAVVCSTYSMYVVASTELARSRRDRAAARASRGLLPRRRAVGGINAAARGIMAAEDRARARAGGGYDILARERGATALVELARSAVFSRHKYTY